MTTVIFLPFLLNQHQFLTLWLVNVPEYTSIFIFFYFMTNIVDSFGLFFITSINGIGKSSKSIYLTVLFPYFHSLVLSYSLPWTFPLIGHISLCLYLLFSSCAFAFIIHTKYAISI